MLPAAAVRNVGHIRTPEYDMLINTSLLWKSGKLGVALKAAYCFPYPCVPPWQIYRPPALPFVTVYLDGAHTEQSMQACLQWFIGKVRGRDGNLGVGSAYSRRSWYRFAAPSCSCRVAYGHIHSAVCRAGPLENKRAHVAVTWRSSDGNVANICGL